MSDPGPQMEVQERVLTLIATGTSAANAYGRSDLADRLAPVQELASNPEAHVVVCGEFKQGKSSLVNALARTDVCPVDDDVATAIPTQLRKGDTDSFEALVVPAEPDQDRTRLSMSRREARSAIVDPEIESGSVDAVEIRLEGAIPAIVVVDTPGTGGLGSAHAKATLAALPIAEMVLFVSDASQEFTAAEMAFLQQCTELCPRVVCIMTKIDLYPAWRTILEVNQQHLQSAGLDLDIRTVSSQLHEEAVRTHDDAMREEAQVDALHHFLVDEVVADSTRSALQRALVELHRVVGMLRTPFEAEKQALTQPDTQEKALADLQAAKETASQLRSGVARWQVTLNDGFTDLSSDVDHDFRSRMRRFASEANAIIDDASPGDIWPEFEPWIEQRVAAEVLENHLWLNERSAELNADIARLFQQDSNGIAAELDLIDPTAAMAEIDSIAGPQFSSQGMVAQGLAVVRGGQSGMMMFRGLGGLAATLLSPIGMPMMALTAAAALASGRGAVKQGSDRHLAQHRNSARSAVRSYTDEVSFRMGQELKANMRRTQRAVRDHYTLRAEELHRTTAAAVEAATAAAKAAMANTGADRLAKVEAELARIDQVTAAVDAAMERLQ